MQYRHGVDNIASAEHLLSGKRLGLITNPTGLSSDFVPTIEILNERYQLCRLYAPEHGVRGDRQAGAAVGDEVDAKTGIPVDSMYGKNGMNLSGIDLVLYDIQDIGLRFYTYIYVLAEAMKQCAKQGVPLLVLDRGNPLGGHVVRGTVIREGYHSGVGGFGLPTRYGLTVGEYARYLNGEYHIGCDLSVLSCTGLTRDMTFPEFGLPWVQQSPNMPTYDTAVCYEGTCLFEGTNLSEGRGTTKPFEMIGAPWMDNDRVLTALNNEHHAGVQFRTVFFEPTFSKHQGTLCRGIQLHVTDARVFDGFTVGLRMFEIIRALHPNDFACLGGGDRCFIDLLTGNNTLRRGLYDAEAQNTDAELISRFREITKPYLLY